MEFFGIIRADHAAAGVELTRFHDQRKAQLCGGRLAIVVMPHRTKSRMQKPMRLLQLPKVQFVAQTHHRIDCVAGQAQCFA